MYPSWEMPAYSPMPASPTYRATRLQETTDTKALVVVVCMPAEVRRGLRQEDAADGDEGVVFGVGGAVLVGDLLALGGFQVA